MTIDYERVLTLDIPAVEYAYTSKDVMLYALGLGIGGNPLDEGELRYVYEKDLAVFPTMPVIHAFASLRDMDLGIDYTQIVHGEQVLTLHAPLPVSATVIGKTRVVDIVDRGEKGAMLYLDRDVVDKPTGRALATVGMGVICRADGGFGGPVTELRVSHPVPGHEADFSVDLPTWPQQALIYRLSGDLNPLHADPAAARRAGFERPILHGLATFGVVARGLVARLLNNDGSRLKSLRGRFSSPVFPGDTLRVEIWCEPEGVTMRARALERDKVVFNNGYATLA
ncbi:MaoC/PaaZ C-terminal domain-containing protein [Paraburkholderia sp. IW21]|jgi:acyl dehydratase|uniref:MaoC/PaaZ C-terminal domain-containing protein n=1 Tax=Paraburkholderia sp. IW21 TaxID=3242488 RepID=UPI003522FC25